MATGEFTHQPVEFYSKYISPSYLSLYAKSSGTLTSVISDSVGRLAIQGAAPINSSTEGLYPVFMGGYHTTTGSLVPLPVTDAGLKVDTELELTGTLVANLYTFKNYAGSIQAALVDSNRRQEVVLAAGTQTAGTITALQGTSPWTVDGTVTSTPSGTQDVDIVAQSLSKLSVGITDTTSTANAVLQTDNIGLMKSTGGTVTALQGTSPWTVDGTVTSTPSGTQDVDIVGQSQIPLETRLYAGTNNVGYVGIYGGTVDIATGALYDASSTALRVLEVAPSGTAVTENVDIVKVGNTDQTGADWTPLFQHLDVDLSTRATETTLSSLNGKVTTCDTGNVSGTVDAQQKGTWNIGTVSALTSGTVSPKTGATWTVTATDLDIRDLTSASDSVAAVQSGAWSVTTTNTSTANAVLQTDNIGLMKSTGGTVTALQGTSPWTVDGTVTSTPSGTQDVDIVGQSLSKLSVGITDTTSTVNAVIQTDNVSLMKSTGGTVTAIPSGTQDVKLAESAIQVPIDVQSRYLTTTTLWTSTNTSAGGTATSAWVDLHTMETKTGIIYCTQASTMIIEVTPTSSTTTAYEYYRDSSVSASVFESKSFTELFYYGRIKVVTPTAGTLSGWFNRLS